MNKKHLTRFAVMATIALMGSTAAWADVSASGTGWSLSDGTLTLNSKSGSNTLAISSGEASTINSAGVSQVVVNRGAASATYSTLMLPATVKPSESAQINAAYFPTSYNPSTVTLVMQSADVIQPNKPYLVEVSGSPESFTFQVAEGTNTIVATEKVEHPFTLNNSCWEFTGTYNAHTWATSPGNVYGYAATDGVFVKAGDNVTIYPMRAYLTCTKPQAVKGLGKVASEESLPDVINVRFVDKDGGTLSIGKMNTRTGEIQMQDRYYDLKGRKLNAKPQNKMMYVNKKVIKH